VKQQVIKKKWFNINAPKVLGGKTFGETYLADPEKAINRKVTTSLMNVTGEPSKQSVSVSFRITSKKGDALETSLTKYGINPSAVRKMMRKKRSKVDDSFVVKTKDGLIIRIKPVLITKGKTKGSVLAILKHKSREFIATTLKNRNFDDLIKGLVEKKFQKELAMALKKIQPVVISEIRQVIILEGKQAEKVKLIKPSAEPVKEEKPAEEPAPKAEA
jgi:ribosomal protein S3AE